MEAGKEFFNEEEHLTKFTALLDELQGPILPAVRHMDLRGKAWKKPHIKYCTLALTELCECRDLSSIMITDSFAIDFKFSEFLKAGSFWLWEKNCRSNVELSRISHLPFAEELSGDFINYYLFVHSLFVSKRKTYEELISAADLLPFLDSASDIDDADWLNIARNNLDSLFYLSPEQSENWYKPLDS